MHWQQLWIVVVVFLAAAAVAILLRSPRNDRNWIDALSRPPQFTPVEQQWEIRNFRASVFDENGVVNQKWRDERIDPERLHEIWFFVEPFESWDGAAHTLLSFRFDGQTPKTISVSVEARREVGEKYSGLKGALNKFELIYIWSTEEDILTRIAINLDHPIYAYKLNVTPEQGQAILAHFIERSNSLRERPRFYNTFFSNCTNELAKAVNSAFPGALPWHPSHILTGRSAERLHSLGFITPESAGFSEIKARAEIKDRIQSARASTGEEFANAWRVGVEIAAR